MVQNNVTFVHPGNLVKGLPSFKTVRSSIFILLNVITLHVSSFKGEVNKTVLH